MGVFPLPVILTRDAIEPPVGIIQFSSRVMSGPAGPDQAPVIQAKSLTPGLSANVVGEIIEKEISRMDVIDFFIDSHIVIFEALCVGMIVV
jgi:hypothetical protein